MLDNKRLQESLQGTRHVTEESGAERIDSSTRSTINRDLDRKFKNQFFDRVGQAINVLTQVLNAHGFEEADIFSANRFDKDKGHETFRIARKTDDPFSPIEVSNSMLVIQYGKAGDHDRFEVLAYLS